MKIVLDILQIHKCFRIIGIHICKGVLCLTVLWYYKETYDSGVGLFRIQIGEFVEYREKFGIKIETLSFSLSWFKKSRSIDGA